MSLQRKLSMVFLGYLFAQVILVLASPFISRLYSATDMGAFGYVAAYCAAVLPLGSLRYEYALPLLKHIKTRFVLVRICQSISIFMSIVLVVFYAIHASMMGERLEMMNFTYVVLLLSTQFLIQIMNCFLISIGDVSLLTIGKIIQNSIFVFIQLILPFLFFANTNLLLLALLFAQLANLLYLTVVSQREFRHLSLCKIQYRRTACVLLRQFKRFPLWTSWSSLLNSFTSMLPSLCIGGLFGQFNLGLYYFTFRIIAAPLGVVTQTVSQVFLKEFADKVIYHRPIQKKFFTTSLWLVILSVFYVVSCHWLADIDTLIFGDKWGGAGEVIRYMSFPMGMMLIASPLSSLLNTLGRNMYLSGWQIAFFVTSICVIVLVKYQSFHDFLFALSLCWSLMYIFYWLVIMMAVRYYEQAISNRGPV